MLRTYFMLVAAALALLGLFTPAPLGTLICAVAGLLGLVLACGKLSHRKTPEGGKHGNR